MKKVLIALLWGIQILFGTICFAQIDKNIINNNVIRPIAGIDVPKLNQNQIDNLFNKGNKENWPELKRGENNLVPRIATQKPNEIILNKNNVAGVFAIKFAEGSHVRLEDGKLFIDEKNLGNNKEEQNRLARAKLNKETANAQLNNIIEILNNAKAKANFEISYMHRDPKKKYDNDQQFIEKSELENKVAEELADLDLYYVLYAKEFKDIDFQQELINKLNGFELIEMAYPLVLAEGAGSVKKIANNLKPKHTPDISGLQTYLNAAPGGIDARFAWTIPGGRGDGIRVTDVEYDWVTDHEDFPTNRFWGGRPACVYDRGGSEHGTAVMGVLAAPHNGFGAMGITPNVQYGLSSTCRPFDYAWASMVATFSGENWGGRCHNVVVANAINAAAGALRAGDVLLIEQHVPGPGTGRPCNCNCSQWEYVPMEYYQESFDVIRLATARGIIVVEAAGNGSQNLDAGVYGNRFNTFIRNSQAIMVGASNAGDRVPACFSNTGNRVDVHGWGGGVVTLGYGDGAAAPNPFNHTIIREFYTQGFSGTSSASPIVSGAVASVQGVRRSAAMLLLNPFDMRRLLRSTGSPQVAGANIGPLPNLRNAINNTIAMPSSFTGPGVYTIKVKSSGKVLDINEAFCFWCGPDGKKLQQWDAHGGLNQQFNITNLPGGFVRIQAMHSGRVLDVQGNSMADGAVVTQFASHGGNNQQFTLRPMPGGFMQIVARHSGKVLDVSGAIGNNGATIIQHTSYGGDNQLFQFIRIR